MKMDTKAASDLLKAAKDVLAGCAYADPPDGFYLVTPGIVEELRTVIYKIERDS